MTASLRVLLLLFLCARTTFGQFDFGASKNNQVTPSLTADTTAIVPGKPFTVLVQLKMKEGWHVYWQFSGDSGLAPKVNWDLPEGFTAGPVQWPLPTKHFDAETDQTTYIYENEALLPVQITPPAQISASEVQLKAKLSWLVCEKTCIPGQGNVSVSLPVAAQAAEANADLFATARTRLPKTDAPAFRATWDVKPQAFTVTVSGLPKDVSVEFFPLPPKGVRPEVAKVSEPDEQGNRTITVAIKSGGTTETAWQGLLVTKTGEARTGWTISSAAPPPASTPPPSGSAPESKPAATPDAEKPPEPAPSSPPAPPSASAPTPPAPPAVASAVGQRSLLGWLWFAFLGGLILNLMPCVLPVISLKIFSFVSQAGQEPARVFRLGLAFVAGVFVFFLGMAAAAIALHAAGKTFFWGMWFADARLSIGLISIIVVFALSMFGVFEITLGGAENVIGGATRKEGYAGAFVHGLFTTLLGTSCTAPILGAVLGFLATQTPVVIVLAFLLMAAGMSLPYFLLTWHPKWLRFLPKPGAWMERFKQIMGFVLLAVAIWLLGVMGKSRGVEAMTSTVYFLAVVAFATWIYGIGHRRWWALFIAIAIGIGGGKVFLPAALSKAKAAEASIAANEFGITWEPFSEARVNSARANRQPVFIDFTAEWCLNCKTNEKLVINTTAVSAALKAKNVLTLKADWTDFDEEIGNYIKKLGRAGVPVYVLYRPGEENPIVFPEILTQKIVTDELDKIRSSDLVKGG